MPPRRSPNQEILATTHNEIIISQLESVIDDLTEIMSSSRDEYELEEFQAIIDMIGDTMERYRHNL